MRLRYNDIHTYRFRLAEPVEVKLEGTPPPDVNHDWFLIHGGTIRIKDGYMWDGTSGPTMQTRGNRLAGLVHDALYQCIRGGYLDASWKDFADRQLRHLVATYRSNRCVTHILRPWRHFRGWYYYWGVRWFGAASVKPNPKGEANKVVLEA